MAVYQNVFVTVGTTQFEELIDCINSEAVSSVLKNLGCKRLVVQYGSGRSVNLSTYYNNKQIDTEAYALKASIQNDLLSADLVISHAGAGSIIESLKHTKPTIVVVNEKLMDNHQTELAERMNKDKHVLYCVPSKLALFIGKLRTAILLPYTSGSVLRLTDEIDTLMGFQ